MKKKFSEFSEIYAGKIKLISSNFQKIFEKFCTNC